MRWLLFAMAIGSFVISLQPVSKTNWDVLAKPDFFIGTRNLGMDSLLA